MWFGIRIASRTFEMPQHKSLFLFFTSSYQQSEKYLKSALEKIRDVSHEVVAEKWEPLLNNLGHTCRKLR